MAIMLTPPKGNGLPLMCFSLLSICTIKLIKVYQTTYPSGIVWVQFDHTDVGAKTRQENRHLYVSGIQPTWTPIKPVTTQFAVGRNRAVQVVRKQFPLRPAAAKTIYRSQGDTETRIVVKF